MLRYSQLTAAALSLLTFTTLRADFTVAFQLGVTNYPGTSTPITGGLSTYALHNGGVVMVTRTALGPTVRNSLLQHKAGSLTTLLNDTGGFPGGGDINTIDVRGDGTIAYVIARRAAPSLYDRAALLKLENGTLSTIVANSDTLVPRGNNTFAGFSLNSVGGGTIGFIGHLGQNSHYLFRHQSGAPVLAARESVTDQPGTTGKFGSFSTPVMSSDGTRLYFYGTNGQSPNNAAFRAGVYVEQAGTISRIVDSTVDVPGTTAKFNPDQGVNFIFSPNGVHTLFLGGAANQNQATATNRYGLYRVNGTTLTTALDNTTQVEGGPIGDLNTNNVVVTNDGTIFIRGNHAATNATHIFRVRPNGTLDIFLRDNSGGVRSPGRIWLQGSQLFIAGFNSSFQTALFRMPVDGSAAPVEALNLTTHPTLVALNARTLDDVRFGGGQVLIHVGALANGALNSTLLYGPASDVTGDPSDNTPGGGSGGGGGGSTGNTRLANLSVRAAMAANQTLIVGFSVDGGSRPLLIRGVGPTLGALGVPGVMADPRLEVFNAASALVTQNDDWGSSASLAATFASVGAFPLDANSRDAALVQPVSGSHSVHLKSAGAGVALVELYDTGAASSAKLVNVSALNHVGTGGDILIFGFVVDGTGSKNLLIRAIGPKLADFGIATRLADPKLEVFRVGTAAAVASNDNWDASLATTFSSVGAFALTNGSRDAALTTSVTPGAYTVHITGVNDTTGDALVEVYELR